MSENRTDATAAAAADESPSIERARYWFDQYRFASRWESRLIRAIREQLADRTRGEESV